MSLRATEVIRLAFVRDVAELESGDSSHHYYSPLFAHQVYSDETIEGHGKPTVDLIYSAVDLQLCLIVKPDPLSGSDASSTTDLMEPWSNLIKHPFTVGTGLSSAREALAKSEGFRPPGEKIHEYRWSDLNPEAASEGGHEDSVYEVYQGSLQDTEFATFHRRIQLLNILFIDGASYIDEEDSNWLVHTLFERREVNGVNEYTFVGFATLYKFFAFPENTRHRVSQFLILPPYQGKGHAVKLLSAILTNAQNDSDCLELLVEDPTESFQRVRWLVELKYCVDNKVFQLSAANKDHWLLSKEAAKKISRACRISLASVYRVHEILRQQALGLGPTDDELKEFRLLVKTRLFRKNEFHTEVPESEVKEKLAAQYEQVFAENAAILARLRKCQ